MLNPQTALIHAMVIVSAADRDMADAEMHAIGEMVQHLPVFRGYNRDQLTADARACGRLVRQEDGFRQTLELIANSLPSRLRETCYALACDVAAAAHDKVSPEEARVLQLLRQHLKLDRLVTVAIERAARARHMTL